MLPNENFETFNGSSFASKLFNESVNTAMAQVVRNKPLSLTLSLLILTPFF